MRYLSTIVTVLLALLLESAFAQSPTNDLADQALISAFQRDNGSLLCLSKVGTLKEVREVFNPYISGIDLSDKNSYPALARAVYAAFPCPFSADRPELRPATKDNIVGDWLFPEASIKLRHGPQSKAAVPPLGVPTIKCEAVSYGQTGVYRVAQMRGQLPCPTNATLRAADQLPVVSTWSIMETNRIKISRTDVPSHFEEWELFAVQKPFDSFGVHFSSGDLLAYERREPGNEIGAVTAFRHLQRMK